MEGQIGFAAYAFAPFVAAPMGPIPSVPGDATILRSPGMLDTSMTMDVDTTPNKYAFMNCSTPYRESTHGTNHSRDEDDEDDEPVAAFDLNKLDDDYHQLDSERENQRLFNEETEIEYFNSDDDDNTDDDDDHESRGNDSNYNGDVTMRKRKHDSSSSTPPPRGGKQQRFRHETRKTPTRLPMTRLILVRGQKQEQQAPADPAATPSRSTRLYTRRAVRIPRGGSPTEGMLVQQQQQQQQQQPGVTSQNVLVN